MRKKKGQEKQGKQQTLFETAGVSLRPEVSKHSGTMRSGGESIFFSELARNRALAETLLETVMSSTNLNEAYVRVKRNKGMGGVDGMSVGELSTWLRSNGENLIKTVLAENYEPQAVLGLEIEKASGGTRLLGIPTVKDRLIQQAIQQQLTKLYDPLFSDTSYGFRPNRSAQQAIRQSSEYISEGYNWVVDIDLKAFFDYINHDRLMQRLQKGIGDSRLLRLIHKYLRAGMMQGGVESQRISGTPQGGPLSPLLSNIVLDELDKELEKRDHLFVRYADDCNIYVKSERAGKQVLESITKFIESKLKLKVNKEKSGVRHCEEVSFLGYTVMSNGKIRVSDKSIKRYEKKVRTITKRNRGVSFKQIISELNAASRGWINYFRLANCWLPWKRLDGWIRRRMRCYRLKQCGRKYTLFKLLSSLGITKHKAWNVINFGGNWWQMSKKVTCSRAMGTTWFKKEGLYALQDLYTRFKC